MLVDCWIFASPLKLLLILFCLAFVKTKKFCFCHVSILSCWLLYFLTQYLLLIFNPNVGVEGELKSKNGLSPKTLECTMALLLMLPFFALPRAQSSHGLKVLVTWIPIDLAVAWVMTSEGWPNSMCRLFTFFFMKVLADSVPSWKKFDSGYPAMMSLDTAI